MKHVYVTTYLWLVVLITLPLRTYGQSAGMDGEGVTLQNPLGSQTLTGLFSDILKALIVFAVPIIVFFIIFAGFQFVTARGDVTKIQNARNALLYAVIGGVLILGAQVLLFVIGDTIDALGS